MRERLILLEKHCPQIQHDAIVLDACDDRRVAPAQLRVERVSRGGFHLEGKETRR